MTVTVLKPGLMTTVQDQGRPGYQKNGVSPSGVMDRWALRLANVLVGNNENAACLEITLLGPSLYFNSEEQIAIAGADLTAAIGGSNIPLYRPVWIKKGQTLTFGHPKTGCRAYLAFAGGIEVPVILGSRSTFFCRPASAVFTAASFTSKMCFQSESARTVHKQRDVLNQ
ncbi:hypothetical protein QS257_17430 [Terrilactibacillus sp. S3-3]|nr:hypothetical protein QS257_17430 [Terrilactibacillus sp. S3-3]